MDSLKVFLEKKLEEKKIALASISDKLILEDAPKNRFSINTGKHLMIEEIEQDIAQHTREMEKQI